MKRKLAVMFTTAFATAMSAMCFAMNTFASEAAADGAAADAQKAGNPLLTLGVPLIFFFVLLYFMLIRPQKKREQEQKDLQSSIQVGDEIVTTGGIVGLVVRVAEDTIVIETGGERTKLRVKNWAVAENVSAAERAKAAAPKKKSGLAQAGLVDEKKPEKKEPEKKSKKKKDSEE